MLKSYALSRPLAVSNGPIWRGLRGSSARRTKWGFSGDFIAATYFFQKAAEWN
jgi:hypothetical protein